MMITKAREQELVNEVIAKIIAELEDHKEDAEIRRNIAGNKNLRSSYDYNSGKHDAYNTAICIIHNLSK